MLEPLATRYQQTRRESVALCEPLQIEDYGLQAEPFTSPPKWHLAHTTWFFETFLLKPWLPDHQSPEPLYEVLFNSYYHGVGAQFPRPQRGLLTRPTVAEIMAYRTLVDEAMARLLQDSDHPQRAQIQTRTQLGIEHERQHQELFFTDLKYSLAVNPLQPCYQPHHAAAHDITSRALTWSTFPAGLVTLGHDGAGFCFDNELPQHRAYLTAFELADRLVSNAEYEAFIADDGYRRPELWLADGWDTVQQQGWQKPHYWRDQDGAALEYTLHGLQARQANNPVCHISGYEADAFARWAQARLPTEQEWEVAAQQAEPPARGVDDGYFHPRPAATEAPLQQLYGDCWQWTRSAYSPYPGYRASAGAIGEYNGKFMSNQWVLRGGSCVTKADHVRTSYRNFFYPPDRWQFSGIRLARDPD